MITYYAPKMHPLTLKWAYRLTDADLSELLGISERNIQRYTAGDRNPSVQTQKLCGLLHEQFQRQGMPCNHHLIEFIDD